MFDLLTFPKSPTPIIQFPYQGYRYES